MPDRPVQNTGEESRHHHLVCHFVFIAISDDAGSSWRAFNISAIKKVLKKSPSSLIMKARIYTSLSCLGKEIKVRTRFKSIKATIGYNSVVGIYRCPSLFTTNEAGDPGVVMFVCCWNRAAIS